jgi:hypothetical protein
MMRRTSNLTPLLLAVLFGCSGNTFAQHSGQPAPGAKPGAGNNYSSAVWLTFLDKSIEVNSGAIPFDALGTSTDSAKAVGGNDTMLEVSTLTIWKGQKEHMTVLQYIIRANKKRSWISSVSVFFLNGPKTWQKGLAAIGVASTGVTVENPANRKQIAPAVLKGVKGLPSGYKASFELLEKPDDLVSLGDDHKLGRYDAVLTFEQQGTWRDK